MELARRSTRSTSRAPSGSEQSGRANSQHVGNLDQPASKRPRRFDRRFVKNGWFRGKSLLVVSRPCNLRESGLTPTNPFKHSGMLDFISGASARNRTGDLGLMSPTL